jgi:hypothetical protein
LIEGKFVGRFQTAASGQTVGDPGECDRFVFQQVNNVIGGGFAFDISSQSKNDLGEFVVFDTLKQLFDPQIIRADVIERRDSSP